MTRDISINSYNNLERAIDYNAKQGFDSERKNVINNFKFVITVDAKRNIARFKEADCIWRDYWLAVFVAKK